MPKERFFEMLARLGKVIYWFFCILAGLSAALGIMTFFSEGRGLIPGIFLFGSVVFWAFGRAALYVLAGK